MTKLLIIRRFYFI